MFGIHRLVVFVGHVFYELKCLQNTLPCVRRVSGKKSFGGMRLLDYRDERMKGCGEYRGILVFHYDIHHEINKLVVTNQPWR